LKITTKSSSEAPDIVWFMKLLTTTWSFSIGKREGNRIYEVAKLRTVKSGQDGEVQTHAGIFWRAETQSCQEKAFASSRAEMSRRGNEYNRETGCAKTAHQGLCGGCRATGIPTTTHIAKPT